MQLCLLKNHIFARKQLNTKLLCIYLKCKKQAYAAKGNRNDMFDSLQDNFNKTAILMTIVLLIHKAHKDTYKIDGCAN